MIRCGELALRHLLDMQSKDKRCGRPPSTLPIPIPKHLQNGGHLSKKRNTMLRPSEMGYNWKGTNNSDGTSYNQLFSANPNGGGGSSSTQRNIAHRQASRPAPKKETLRNRKLLASRAAARALPPGRSTRAAPAA